MKKQIFAFALICIAYSVSAQMDNLINLSPNWVASPARNASCDATDAVVYNPAATTRLDSGFHIGIGNQSLYRNPSHTYDLGTGSTTSSQVGGDPFLPNLYFAYANHNWSAFGGVFIAGGGATVNYPSGSLTTNLIGFQSVMATGGAYTEAGSQYLKASSYYITSTMGISYNINKIISGSLSLRYLVGTNKTQGGIALTSSPFELPDMQLKMDYNESATGAGAVLSAFIQPSEKTAFSIRYESQVNMNFETNLIQDDFGVISDGAKSRRNLPAVMAVGFSQKVHKNITVLGDVNYYFQTAADWGKTMNANGEEVSLSQTAGDAISYCIAANIGISSRFSVSTGAGFSDFMFNDIEAYYTHLGAFETAPNDNINFNLGASYRAGDHVRLTGGYMHTWWKSANINSLASGTGVSVKNAMDVMAIGVDLNF